MTEMPVQAGIVDCLSMDRSHVEVLATVDGADLVGRTDHTAKTARSFGETYGCPSHTDHAALSADADFDAVYVYTPSGAHHDIVVDAAVDGIDVFCEKLSKITPDRVDDMAAVCRDVGVTLACIFQRRLFPTMQFAREMVRDGRFGRFVFVDVRARWHRDRSYYDVLSQRGNVDLDDGVLPT